MMRVCFTDHFLAGQPLLDRAVIGAGCERIAHSVPPCSSHLENRCQPQKSRLCSAMGRSRLPWAGNGPWSVEAGTAHWARCHDTPQESGEEGCGSTASNVTTDGTTALFCSQRSRCCRHRRCLSPTTSPRWICRRLSSVPRRQYRPTSHWPCCPRGSSPAARIL